MKSLLIFCLLSINTLLFAQNQLDVIIQTGHAGKINSVLFSPDDTKIYSAGKDAKIVVWDIRTGMQESEIIAHESSINQIGFYNDSTLISVSDDKFLKFWDIRDMSEVKSIGPFEYEIKSFDVNQKTGQIVVGTRFVHLIGENDAITKLKSIAYKYYDAVHFLEEKNYIIYGGKMDKFTRVIDAETFDIIKSINISATSIDSHNEDEIVIGGYRGEVYYYGFKSNKEKKYSIELATTAINSVDISLDKILISRSDGIVEELNKKKFVTYDYFKGHISEVTDAKFSQRNELFVSSDYEGNIILWNNKNRRIKSLFKGEANPINVCKFSADENQIFIGYSNGILRSIDLTTNTVLANRLYFGQEEKLKGWKYSIIEIGDQIGDEIYFEALKTKSFVENTELLSYCQIFSGKWDTKKNKITLIEEIRKEETKALIKDQSNGKRIAWETHFLDLSDMEVKAKYSSRHLRVLESKIELFDKNKKTTKASVESNHSDLITGILYNKKYDIAITYSWDGSIKIWNIDELEESASLYLFNQRDFLWLNPKKYYFSSKGALENVAFAYDHHVYPFDQFDVKYNRPDLIYGDLPFVEDFAVEEMKKAYYKRLKKLGIKVEDIKISSDLPILKAEIPENTVVMTPTIPIKLEANHPSNPILEIKVLVNGVPLNDEIPSFDKTSKKVKMEINIPLTSGENYIECFAVNSAGVKSLKEAFTIENKMKMKKPDLYIATIGVSNYAQSDFNLNYAAKDSKDFIQQFEKCKLYKNVHTLNLYDSMATLKNIKNIKDFVSKASYDDVVILFAAGHGVLDNNLDYFFANYDMDFYSPSTTGVPYETLAGLLEHTKSRKKMLLLDACHSGEVDKDEVAVSEEVVEKEEDMDFRVVGNSIKNKSGKEISSFQLSKMLFADTRESNGSTVISSASGTEYAIEGKSWNNGVFTYSFLEGLNSKEADINGDGIVLLSEMQTFINIKVLELTNGKQNPNSRVENLKIDFRLW